MLINKVHHVAYRCIDAKQTVEWYGKHLDMKFVLAIAEDEVPSTKAPDPYMHVFLDAGQGNVLAFFERPIAATLGVLAILIWCSPLLRRGWQAVRRPVA